MPRFLRRSACPGLDARYKRACLIRTRDSKAELRIPTHCTLNSPYATRMHLSYHVSTAGDPCQSAADTARSGTSSYCVYHVPRGRCSQQAGLGASNHLNGIEFTVSRQSGTAGNASKIISFRAYSAHRSTIAAHAAGCRLSSASTLPIANEVSQRFTQPRSKSMPLRYASHTSASSFSTFGCIRPFYSKRNNGLM